MAIGGGDEIRRDCVRRVYLFLSSNHPYDRSTLRLPSRTPLVISSLLKQTTYISLTIPLMGG